MPTPDRATLETPRLLLRPPDSGDIGAITAIVGDWEVARRLARVPHPYGEDDARFFLDQIVPTEFVWAIVWRASGEMIGIVGLQPTPDRDVAELGYYVGRPHWGLGIATEAARAVLDHGIHALGLRRIDSGHFQDNPASGRVLRKLGFVEIGRAERPSLAVGSAMPSVQMRLEIAAP